MFKVTYKFKSNNKESVFYNEAQLEGFIKLITKNPEVYQIEINGKPLKQLKSFN